MILALSQPFRRLGARWLDRRLGPAGSLTRLSYRRLFILPSRGGIIFMLMIFAMWLGAVNYISSMAFLLCFLLAGIGIVCKIHAFRNLLGLELRMESAEPVFAGGKALFPLHVNEKAGRKRYGLEFCYPGIDAQPLDADADADTCLMLCIDAPTRGRLKLDQFMVLSRFPGGLVTAWSWLRFNASTIVYPTPESGMVPTPSSTQGDDNSKQFTEGDEDFRGLRRYQAGDSLRRVSWKTLARGQELQTKEYALPTGNAVWLDWDSLQMLTPEARLSRLARWVLDAEEQNRPYGLRLPGLEIPPSSGPAQSHRCLTALALMPGGEGT